MKNGERDDCKYDAYKETLNLCVLRQEIGGAIHGSQGIHKFQEYSWTYFWNVCLEVQNFLSYRNNVVLNVMQDRI